MCHNYSCPLYSVDIAKVKGLVAKVRILCLVMTYPVNLKTKAVHVQATWGRRFDKLLFVSERSELVVSLSLFSVSAQLSGYHHLPAKTKQAFDHAYKRYFNDFDWFMKTDDDTYVIVENLRLFLASQNTSEPVFFGHHLKPFVLPQGYLSGGAGYVLSKEALRRFGTRPFGLCANDTGFEDILMGDCMQKLGVVVGDSRDEFNRSRFHGYSPDTIVHGKYSVWYRYNDFHGAKQVGIQYCVLTSSYKRV